jgi:VIT1/CCC1 family predicted Fe2+/Mn2+ transporter
MMGAGNHGAAAMSSDGPAGGRGVRRLGRTQEFLKPIVYGGNDGIVTTFAIVAGFAGASAEGAAQVGGLAVIVFGLANLFADAVSMGLGEFLSARSERDLYVAKRNRELREMRGDGAGDIARLLSARGLPAEDAEAAAAILARTPAVSVDLLMAYRFGLDDTRREPFATRALFTFMAFIAFGAVPLVPYFLLEPVPGTFRLSVAATAIALVSLGLLRWNATGERLLRCVGETVLVGGVCSVIAYAVGMWVGG